MNPRILSLILTFVLLVSALAGCGENGTLTADITNGNDLSDAYIDPDWPRPYYSDFSLPGETGELVLYTAGSSTGDVMRPAVEIFKSLYPDVNVTYETVGEDEFDERIRAELPAGKGPDLILFVNRTIPDVYKTESTGLFEDLGGYFEVDPVIDRADFVPGVMDGMLFRGQQFIVPLHYEVPLLVTSRALLDEVGVEDPSNFENLAEAARGYRNLHPEGTLFLDTGDTNPVYTNRQQLIRHAGIAFIDYQRGEVSCDEEKLREVMDLLKLYYDPDYVVGDYGPNDYKQYGDYITHGCLLRKECLFNDFDTGYSNFATVCKALEISGDEAAAFIPKDPYGGITANITEMAAIPNASKNKLNAWRLMKILLSDEIQGGHDENRYDLSYLWSGFPVRHASIESSLTASALDAEAEKEESIPLSLITREEYIELVQSPTDASMVPNMYRRLIDEEIMPYIRDEKTWNQCYKSFVKALKSYMKS